MLKILLIGKIHVHIHQGILSSPRYFLVQRILFIVTTPTRPQLNSKIGFDIKMTLYHHHPPPTHPPQTQCHQCSLPDFNQTLKVGLWDLQQQQQNNSSITGPILTKLYWKV